MKNLLKINLSLILLLIMSCSKNDSTINIQPESQRYLIEEYSENYDCIERDYLKLNIAGQTIEYNYNTVGQSVGLCNFSSGNIQGICNNCEGNSARLPMPIDYNEYFPDLPVQIGSTYFYDDSPVTDLNIKGLNIIIIVPDQLKEQTYPGRYKYAESVGYDLGMSIKLIWEVKMSNGETESGYVLTLATDEYFKLELTCVDKSNPDFIRVSGNFEGIFEGQSFSNLPGEAVYEIPVSGRFSYPIAL